MASRNDTTTFAATGDAAAPVREAPRLSTFLDRSVDLGVVSLAVWTVLYHAGLMLHAHTDVLVLVWLVATLAIAVAATRHRGSRGPSAPGPAVTPVRWRALAISALLGVGAAACAASGRSALWWPAWALAAAAAVTAALRLIPVPRRERRIDAEAVPGLLATLLALGAGLGFAAFSVFNYKPDGDDTYYINHAQWVADHGTLATRDTLFTSQKLPVMPGNGEPISSLEAFEGAIAHLAHVGAGSIAYFVTCPVGTFLAVWALWRLIRALAPRRLALCFAVALCYLVYATVSPPMLGDFFASRMQAGKVVFVAALVPLLYTYLVRWGERGGRPEAFRLVAAGIAGVGLSSTSLLVIPLICTAGALPLALRRSYQLAAGCYLACAYPVLVGVVVRVIYGTGDDTGFRTTRTTFGWTFGPSTYAFIGLLALLLAFEFTRRGMPQLTVLGISIVTLILLAPGVLPLMRLLIGSGPVLWRTMWVAPLPALVGVAASIRLPERFARAGYLPGAALVAVLVATGLPYWSSAEGVTLTSPRWRVDPVALHDARAIVHWYRGPGPIYAPPLVMRATAFVTTTVHAVSPRYLYLELQTEPRAQHHARIELADLMQTAPGGAIPAHLRQDLELLKVDLACLPPGWSRILRAIRHDGYRDAARIAGLDCLHP